MSSLNGRLDNPSFFIDYPILPNVIESGILSRFTGFLWRVVWGGVSFGHTIKATIEILKVAIRTIEPIKVFHMREYSIQFAWATSDETKVRQP